jgi:thymidine phosphorylase
MSKKLAAGTKSIVLDVKYGSGAFMTTPEAARELAENMVTIGHAAGRRVTALITNMDMPLGHAVGNILEVKEALEVLDGTGPDDLRTVCLALATEMASLALGITERQAKKLCDEAIVSGAALAKFKEWIEFQGGDTKFIDSPILFPTAKYSIDVAASRDGYISHMNTERIGSAAVALGAGRVTKDDEIDYTAGLNIIKKTGDYVLAGECIATLYTNNEPSLQTAKDIYLSAITFSEEQAKELPPIHAIIRKR